MRTEIWVWAVVAGALAGWCAVAEPAARRAVSVLELGSAGPGPAPVAARAGHLSGLTDPSRLLLLAGAVGAGVAVLAGSPVAAGVVLVAVLAAGRMRAARTRRLADESGRAAVLEVCAVLVSELRAGRAPREALRWAAPTDHEIGSMVSAALRYDRDPAVALREISERPGAAGLRRLSACWQAADRGGSGLAMAVDRVAEGLRAEEAQRREVSAQLAAPRATARLLAVLPVFGLVLAAGLGGRPLHILTHTPYGLACLVLGILLDLGGLVWTERIAKAAESAV
jgi:tight adherence protein B